MSEVACYDLRLLCDEQQLRELPDDVRAAIWKVLPAFGNIVAERLELGHDKSKPGVYRHDSPPFEIHYQIDSAKKRINLRQIATPVFKPRVKVFISYAHKDRKWLAELIPYMDELEQTDNLIVHSDKEIETGADYRQQIRQFIGDARFAVLLVTQWFLASKFIKNEELPLILERHRAGSQVIHWILFEDAMWQRSPLEPIQAAIPTERPLIDLPRRQRLKAYNAFAQSLLEQVRKATDAA